MGARSLSDSTLRIGYYSLFQNKDTRWTSQRQVGPGAYRCRAPDNHGRFSRVSCAPGGRTSRGGNFGRVSRRKQAFTTGPALRGKAEAIDRKPDIGSRRSQSRTGHSYFPLLSDGHPTAQTGGVQRGSDADGKRSYVWNGSKVRIRDPSESGRPSGGNPTLGSPPLILTERPCKPL